MTTLQQQVELLTFGYIHRYCQDVPIELIELMQIFYDSPPTKIKDMIMALPLEDEMENKLQVSSIRCLEEGRVQIYGAVVDCIRSAQYVLAVECVPADPADDTKNDEMSEKIIVVDGDEEIDIIELEDKITMEGLIEFANFL